MYTHNYIQYKKQQKPYLITPPTQFTLQLVKNSYKTLWHAHFTFGLSSFISKINITKRVSFLFLITLLKFKLKC